MKATAVFGAALVFVLGAKLSRAQSQNTAGAASPPATAAAATPAPTPADADKKTGTGSTQPAPAEPKAGSSTGAPAVATPVSAAPPLSEEKKKRAAEFQIGRIQELTKRMREEEKNVSSPSPAAAAAPEAEANKAKAQATIAEMKSKRDAAATALAALGGATVSPESAKKALEIQKKELEDPTAPASPQEVEARQTTMAVLSSAAEPASAGPQNQTVAEVELPKGDRLHYGPTVSLLRVSSLRNPGEPGRYRNYEGRYEFVPAEFGFQFLFAPHNAPWRYKLSDGKNFQLLSAGGMLLAGIDKDNVQRGNLSLAATLSFFQEIIGLGVGVDLYRGVPVQGADGQSGSDTAFTGLLAWSLMRRGEVTPENVFFVVTLGLEPLVRSVAGEL